MTIADSPDELADANARHSAAHKKDGYLRCRDSCEFVARCSWEHSERYVAQGRRARFLKENPHSMEAAYWRAESWHEENGGCESRTMKCKAEASPEGGASTVGRCLNRMSDSSEEKRSMRSTSTAARGEEGIVGCTAELRT